jgi:hypothetical protein
MELMEAPQIGGVVGAANNKLQAFRTPSRPPQGGTLGVGIHQEDGLGFTKNSGQINGGGGFTHSAFTV